MKISKTDCLRTPKTDGFYMPGEFEPHEGTLMIWPWRPGSWNYGAKAARAAFAEIAEAIAAYEQVYLFVRPQDKASAQELLSSDRIHLIEASTEDAWARDTGATFVVTDQGVFDDGLGFRYEYQVPQVDSVFVMDELTSFNLAQDGKSWSIPEIGRAHV